MLSSFNLQPNSELGLCLAIILLSGFLLTRITKLLKLPNVTAYILTGVLLGPFLIGLGFFFFRIFGKLIGSWIGCSLIQAPATTRKTFGLALVPSAGVAIGLAALGQRILPGEYGTLLSTVILSTAILYEIIGPLCAKTSLILSGSIPKENLHPAHHKHSHQAAV